jgi:hypothetical protein
LSEILAETVAFHSPTVWQPKQGKAITAYILKTIIGIFGDFCYYREFISGDSVALEFSAMVGDNKLKELISYVGMPQGRSNILKCIRRPQHDNERRKVAMYLCQQLSAARLVEITDYFNLNHYEHVGFHPTKYANAKG